MENKSLLYSLDKFRKEFMTPEKIAIIEEARRHSEESMGRLFEYCWATNTSIEELIEAHKKQANARKQEAPKG